MAMLLRIGLLVVLAIVVKAVEDFEYTSEIADSLPEYADLQKETSDPVPLKFELANTKNVILLERRADSPGNTLYVKNQDEEDENKTGIKAYCKKSPIERTFNFRELHFNVLQNGEGKPYMELTAKFVDPTVSISLDVVMHLFKPPTEESNEQHSQEHGVPSIGYSIPESLFNELVENKTENESQVFLADVTWMEEVFKRALYRETKPKDAFSKYTEVYFTGPVIMDLNTSNPSGVILAPLAFDNFAKASILKLLS